MCRTFLRSNRPALRFGEPVEAAAFEKLNLRRRRRVVNAGAGSGIDPETLARQVGAKPCEFHRILKPHNQIGSVAFIDWGDTTQQTAHRSLDGHSRGQPDRPRWLRPRRAATSCEAIGLLRCDG